MRTRSDAWLLAAIGLGPLLGSLGALALAPFLPVIADELGTTVPLLGQVPAVMTLVAAALGLVAGPLGDQYGHRRLLLVGSAAVVGYGLGTAVAGSYALLVLAGLVGAVSRAIVNPVSLAVAGARFSGPRQRRAQSIVVAGVAGSGIVGVPLLTGVEAVYGWRGAFVALALAGLLALVLSAAALPPDSAARPGTGMRALVAAYAPLMRHRPTLGLIASSFLRPAALWMMGTYVAAFLVERHGLSVQAAGLAFTAFGLGLLAGSLLAGGGRLGALPARPTVIATAPLIGLVLGVAFVLPVPPAAVMGLIFVGFLLNGVGTVAVNQLLLNETPAGRATTMALNGSALSLGSAAGSSLGGVLLAVGGYGAIGVGMIVLGVAAAAVVQLSRPGAKAAGAAIAQPAAVER